jgi:hypothetical protein
MKEETTNTTAFSKEEVAIINAAFRLHEIIILHRAYKRGRHGRNQFTKGVLQAAEKALARLSPPSPGADPVRVVAHFARQHDVAKAAVMSAIEEAKKSKQVTWDNIRGIELSDADLKALSDESPIFKKYRTVTTLDRAIKELSDPDVVSKAADLVWRLANRVREGNQGAALAGVNNG